MPSRERAIHDHGFGLAAKRQRRALDQRMRPRERIAKRLREEDLAALGPRAETVRRVHGVTDDGELEALLRPDVAGEHLAVIEPDADLELRTPLTLPERVERLE